MILDNQVSKHFVSWTCSYILVPEVESYLKVSGMCEVCNLGELSKKNEKKKKHLWILETMVPALYKTVNNNKHCFL